MSNSLAALYDDYEAYCFLCTILNRYPLPMRGSVYFLDDQKRVLEEYGCSDEKELFELINCVKSSEDQEDLVPLSKIKK